MKYGLLGKQLGHSYSPELHQALGNTAYTLFEKQPGELRSFFADSTLQGLNVTIPYKVDALRACDVVDPRAERIGCVNTMVRRDGTWHGYNTDYAGFCYMLARAGIDVAGKYCLVLGDGATSQTVHVALEDLGAAQIVHLSRRNQPTYDRMAEFYDKAEILINTTPVGMYPHCPEALCDLAPFTKLVGVADVIYNPHRTALLLQAEERGIPHTDGLPMLVAQAVYAAQYFQHTTFPTERIEEIQRGIRERLDNVVLIGMPGAGKSSIGQAVAEALGRPFIDIDAKITERIGDISTYIQTQGEAAFRVVETEVLAVYGKETGQVIATGGGVVTRAENYAHVRQNGRLYHVERPLDALDTVGRVLSQGGRERLEALYQERHPLYVKWRQGVVENTTVEEAANAIVRDFLSREGIA